MAASHPVTTNSSLLQIIMAMSSIALASTLGFYIHPFLLVFTNHIIGSLPWGLLHHWLTPPLLLIALLAALLLFYTDILAQPVPKPQINQQHLAPSGGGGGGDDDDDDDEDNDLTELSDMDTDLDHRQFDNSIEAAAINEGQEVSAENIAPSLAASGIAQRLPRRLTRSKSERGPPTLTSSSRDRQISGNRRVKMVIVADPPTKEEAGEGEHDADQVNQRATDFISGYYQKAKQQR